jgi:hypothetical protein
LNRRLLGRIGIGRHITDAQIRFLITVRMTEAVLGSAAKTCGGWPAVLLVITVCPPRSVSAGYFDRDRSNRRHAEQFLQRLSGRSLARNRTNKCTQTIEFRLSIPLLDAAFRDSGPKPL